MHSNLPYVMALGFFGLMVIFTLVIWIIFFSKKICETCGEKIQGKELRIERNKHMWRVCAKCYQTISEGKQITFVKR